MSRPPHGNNRNTGSSASHRSDYRGRSRSRSPSSSSSSSRSPSPQRRRDQHDQRRDQRPGSTATAKATSAAARQPPTSSSFTVRSPAGKSFGIGKMPAPSSKVLPVQMKLASSKPAEGAKKIAVASAFCNDSDDDDDAVEEMPAECRMRMRNIGRDTPTSSGPNSFGKTKQGFCDSQKIIEKNMKETLKK